MLTPSSCLGTSEAERHHAEHGGVSAAKEISLKENRFEEKVQFHRNPERQEEGHHSSVRVFG